MSVSVCRHRQYPHQPRHPQPAHSRKQICHRPHVGLSGSVLQLLVWHHSTGEQLIRATSQSFTHDIYFRYLPCCLGLLSPNSWVLPHTVSSQTGLLPRPDGPQHPTAGFKEGGYEESGFLPSPWRLLMALRWHHCVCLLLPRCRFVVFICLAKSSLCVKIVGSCGHLTVETRFWN